VEEQMQHHRDSCMRLAKEIVIKAKSFLRKELQRINEGDL
jgi:hypothetical protein